jgi:acetoacetate decarboxylase
MGYKHRPLDPEEARREIGTPMFMLKLMRGYDGRPRIAELTRSQITHLEILEAWEGPARLELFAHALAPLADLPVREVISAHHIITNLRLAAPEVAHDYLAQT